MNLWKGVWVLDRWAHNVWPLRGYKDMWSCCCNCSCGEPTFPFVCTGSSETVGGLPFFACGDSLMVKSMFFVFLLPYSAPEVCEGAINMWFCSWIVYTYDFIVNNNSTVLHMLFIRVWFMFVQGRVCVSVQCFSSNIWHQRDWCGEPSGLFIVDRWHLSQPVSRDRASQLANQQLSFVFSLSFYCRERWSDGGSKRLTHCYLWI